MFAGSAKTFTCPSTTRRGLETTEPYIVVKLDEACRRQQVGEGWFARLEDVPDTAISMSIRQMLNAREMLIIVPDTRKAAAVKATLEGEISPAVPASILRTHPNVTLYLDEPARRCLTPKRGRSLSHQLTAIAWFASR